MTHHKKWKILVMCLMVWLASLPRPSYAATSIPFTVTMSEAVNVTGTPRIVLDVDGNTRYATYSTGTGTASLTFTYAATAGDVDLNGIGIASTSVDLNGGSLTDLNGNPLTNLTFTPPANMASVNINYPSLSMDFIADADGRYSLNGTVYNDLTSFLTAAGGTFTRASTATYYNSAGTLQSAASGTPRFDYDPATLAARGILIEESRTNILIRSAELNNVIWQKDNSSTTTNATAAPDGTLSAEKMVENTIEVRHDIVGFYGAANPSQYYTFSVYLKPAERTYALIQVSDYATGDFRAVFDLVGKTVVSQLAYGDWANLRATLQDAGGGWVRCIITGQKTAAGNSDANVVISTHDGSSETYQGDGSSGFYAWGAQLEQGAFATSYIPTTSAAVTRSNDDLYIPVASWFDATKGSLLGTGISRNAGTGAQLLTAIGTDTLDLIAIRQRSNPDVFFMGREGGTSFDGGGYPGVSLNVLNKIGIAYANSALGVLSLNGAAPQNAGTYLGTYGTSYARLTIGSFPSTGGYWNGTIQKVKYYPSRASNTQLQLLTQ